MPVSIKSEIARNDHTMLVRPPIANMTGGATTTLTNMTRKLVRGNGPAEVALISRRKS